MGLINGDEEPLAIFPDAVTADAIDALLAEAAGLPQQPGRVVPGGRELDRRATVAFLPQDHWAAEILWAAASSANDGMGWRYALTALETVQLTTYHPGDTHGWHMDTLSHGDLVRKLTVVVQLDAPDAYDGGDLELLTFGVPDPSPFALPDDALRRRGTVTVFPSYVLHRVAPVTRGARRTLVGWFVGPRFA